jgi:hypothetical protein
MDVGGSLYSRFQILTEGKPAWALDDRRRSCYFDGFSFWRLNAARGHTPVASWRCPQHGWRHAQGCECSLCSVDARSDSRAA